LLSIEVLPANPSIAVGATQQFTAIGTFSDATQADITTIVSWSSSDTGVATISNAPGSQGLATGVTAGVTTITATLGVQGSTTLTVTTGVNIGFAFMPGGGGLLVLDQLLRCAIDTNGNFNSCVGTGNVALLDSSNQMSVNNAETYAYFNNILGVLAPSITKCDYTSGTGAISNCIDSGADGTLTSFAIGLNAANTLLYKADGGFLRRCDVSNVNGLLSNCQNATTDTAVSDFALNELQARGYTTRLALGLLSGIYECDLNGTGDFINCTQAFFTLSAVPGTLTHEPTNNRLYFASLLGGVTKCDIDGVGDLSNCIDASAPASLLIDGIAFNPAGTLAYLTRIDDVLKCDVEAVSGALQNCVTVVNPPNDPLGITLVY
jgi:hypothetical protein